ncbi:cholesterol oxidase [Rhodococcus sp. SMB37]|uniref:GMC oxidoreductase n=1 Tax=Rhodococcus sp. SMB37 TaxID=2512213 RepID=UPI00104BB8B1|nr:GMC oxidoreductase [Rhodococcus sp. SMB37]TCN51217.1 cholesterol oxidase [Rhodococcus sp. SMB37]
MSSITRRAFLAGAATIGATLAGSSAAYASTGIAARANKVPLTREEHRVVVIGSGFGGGVSALRLAEAGVPVTILERGKRWPTGPDATTFPRVDAPDGRMLWFRSAPELFGRPVMVEPHTGLVEAVVGQNMTALCAAGVGGGSLVYQGMSLQPSEEVFNTHFPNELDWATMNRVHYPRVSRMLGLATAPDELVSHPNYAAARIFAERVKQAGLPLDKIPMPIDWDYALAELRGEMAPSYTDGSGALGVNNGGKYSVDVTYIAAAEATGLVTVQAQHEVKDIERASDGRWTVYVDRIDTSGKLLENKILTTDTLILAAGSLNTTRLLVRASQKGQIPDLPDDLGRNWGSNADRIYLWSDMREDFGALQGGPVVYGSKNWDDPNTAFTVIQASIPAMGLNTRSTVLVGYGISDSRGSFVYDSASDDAILHWPRDGDAAIQSGHIDPMVRRIVGNTGIATDTNAIVPSTWHPLGGASMGSVCDLDGRVHGQRGLYVLDGALLPGQSGACNPSMTIAAVAERALDNIVAKDAGVTI